MPTADRAKSRGWGTRGLALLCKALLPTVLLACADFKYLEGESEWQPTSYVFELDGASYFLDVADAPQSVVIDDVQINASKLSEPYIDILLARYDMSRNQGLVYEASIMTFGLTQSGCCDIESIVNFERVRSNNNAVVEIVEFERIRAVRAESIDNNGDKVLRYQIRFDDRYNLYFNLRVIDELLESQPGVVARRVQMIDDTVKLFANENYQKLSRESSE